MNNRNNRDVERFDFPSNGDEQLLREELEEVYRVPVPAMRFDPAASAAPVTMPERRRWRPALIGAAAAAGLALFLAPSLFGGSPPEVSAQDVLERTKEVAASSFATLDQDSYHMVARSDSRGPGGATANSDTITETWYGDAEHQRTETRDSVTGEVLFGHVRNGDDIWMYAHVDGVLKAVHSTAGGSAFAFGSAGVGMTPGVTDLADLLNAYTSECSEATRLGEEVVAGRPVYVIEVTPKPETCKWEAIKVEAFAEGGPESGGTPAVATGFGVGGGTVKVEPGDGAGVGGSIVVEAAAEGEPRVSTVVVSSGPMRMWVDQETFMTLKSESSFGDEFSHRYEVTAFDPGVELDDGVFGPPVGAEITEGNSPEDAAVLFKGMFHTVSFGSNEFKVEAVPNATLEESE